MIEQKLERIFALQLESASLGDIRQARLEETIPKKWLAAMAKMDTEINAERQKLSDELETLTKEVSDAVLEQGQTVSSEHLQAVFNSGRITWESKALDALVDIHPYLAKHRKVGNPYVTIRDKNRDKNRDK
jgi:hypothetical protein